MLDSRLDAHLRFAELTPQEVALVTPVYHPICTGVPLSLITLVDERCAHGNLHPWAKVSHHAQRLIENSARPALDEEIARKRPLPVRREPPCRVTFPSWVTPAAAVVTSSLRSRD